MNLLSKTIALEGFGQAPHPVTMIQVVVILSICRCGSGAATEIFNE